MCTLRTPIDCAQSLRFPVQDQDRSLLLFTEHFHVQPGDPLRPSRSIALNSASFAAKRTA